MGVGMCLYGSLCPAKGKAKGKGQNTCYSAACMSQTRDQQHFYNIGSGS